MTSLLLISTWELVVQQDTVEFEVLLNVYKVEFLNLSKDFLRHRHVRIRGHRSFAFCRWAFDVRIGTFDFDYDRINAKQIVNEQDFLHLTVKLNKRKANANIN